MIDHSQVVRTHYCEPPAIIVSGPQPDWDKPDFAPIHIAHPAGTRYFCDECPKVWMVVWIPDRVGAQVVTLRHYEWREERRRDRRRRLNAHWWRRSDER